MDRLSQMKDISDDTSCSGDELVDEMIAEDFLDWIQETHIPLKKRKMKNLLLKTFRILKSLGVMQ